MSEGSLRLLLLPAPPSEQSEHAFEAAYKPPLTRALVSASSQPHSVLDIAVLVSGFDEDDAPGPRNHSYPLYQPVLAGIYRLCCHICTEQRIDFLTTSYVDFRVLLVSQQDMPSLAQSVQLSQGPLFSLKTLAAAEKRWSVLQGPEGEAGEALLKQFVDIRRSISAKPQLRSFTIDKVPGGTSLRAPSSQRVASDVEPRRNKVIAVGGTFDNLHEGHKLLLSCTALALEPSTGTEPAPRRLIIGITGDQLLVNKQYSQELETWQERQEASFRFIHNIISLAAPGSDLLKVERRNAPGPNGKAVIYYLDGALSIECVEIQDPFGPTITDEACAALVVSAETRSGGQAVNEKRAEKGWAALEVFEVDVLGPPGSDVSAKISSTEKRKRKLEARNGKL